MKELINFSFLPGHDFRTRTCELQKFLTHAGLDGVELFLYDNRMLCEDILPLVHGVHLQYWPFWLALWLDDRERLEEHQKLCGRFSYDRMDFARREDWLDLIRANITAACSLKPEYLVWHVSDASFYECFHRRFKYSDKDVLKATAEVFREVRRALPRGVKVLFENLWWPGLRLTEPELVDYFFQELNSNRTGITLDISHLANTNTALRSEAEIVDYVCQRVEALGENRSLIKTVHLNFSLSGEYVENVMREDAGAFDRNTFLQHITSIDWHEPFRDKSFGRVLELVQPEFLNHELFYNDFADLRVKLQQQYRPSKRS